jgi:hypothetical protein
MTKGKKMNAKIEKGQEDWRKGKIEPKLDQDGKIGEKRGIKI